MTCGEQKIWDSGLALSSWLWRHLSKAKTGESSKPAPDLLSRKVVDLLREDEEGAVLRILELGEQSFSLSSLTRMKTFCSGSGTGLVSIALALALRQATTAEAMITATDLGA